MQCSVTRNNSTVSERILYRTDTSLTKIIFTTDDIANIIKNLNSNKSHGHDNASIRILHICGVSIKKPLEITFRTWLNHCKFLEVWGKVQRCCGIQKRQQTICYNLSACIFVTNL